MFCWSQHFVCKWFFLKIKTWRSLRKIKFLLSCEWTILPCKTNLLHVNSTLFENCWTKQSLNLSRCVRLGSASVFFEPECWAVLYVIFKVVNVSLKATEETVFISGHCISYRKRTVCLFTQKLEYFLSDAPSLKEKASLQSSASSLMLLVCPVLRGHRRRCFNTHRNHRFVIFWRSIVLINILIWWAEEREKHCWWVQINSEDQNQDVNKPRRTSARRDDEEETTITFTRPSRKKWGREGWEEEEGEETKKKCLKSRGWRALSPQFSWRDYWGISANACF